MKQLQTSACGQERRVKHEEMHFLLLALDLKYNHVTASPHLDEFLFGAKL